MVVPTRQASLPRLRFRGNWTPVPFVITSAPPRLHGQRPRLRTRLCAKCGELTSHRTLYVKTDTGGRSKWFRLFWACTKCDGQAKMHEATENGSDTNHTELGKTITST